MTQYLKKTFIADFWERKSTLSLVLFLLLLLSLGLSLKGTWSENRLLNDQQLERVESEANYFDEKLQNLIVLTKTIAQSEFLKTQLEKSNQAFREMGQAAAQHQMTSLESQWRQAGENSDFVLSYLTNPVSNYLNHVKSANENMYGEIFVTDAFGVMNGSTGRLTAFVKVVVA